MIDSGLRDMQTIDGDDAADASPSRDAVRAPDASPVIALVDANPGSGVKPLAAVASVSGGGAPSR
jgi:hypothetical protein